MNTTSQKNISIQGLFNAPDVYLNFISYYISRIQSFKEAVEDCSNEFFDHKERAKTNIRNADLWIESYIDIIPSLQNFREYVRAEMDRLGIDRYDDAIYKPSNNHYMSDRRSREHDELKEALITLV